MSNAPNSDPEGSVDSFERRWAEWQRETEQRKRNAEKHTPYLSGALRFLGIEKVSAAWDGYGEEGQFEASVFQPSSPTDLPFGLIDAIDRLWDPLLPSGCEINAGSFGTLTLDTATGKALVDIEWRDEDDELEEEME